MSFFFSMALVDLSHQGIETIDEKILQELNSISSLSLSHNFIHEFPGLMSCSIFELIFSRLSRQISSSSFLIFVPLISATITSLRYRPLSNSWLLLLQLIWSIIIWPPLTELASQARWICVISASLTTIYISFLPQPPVFPHFGFESIISFRLLLIYISGPLSLIEPHRRYRYSIRLSSFAFGKPWFILQ